MTDCIEAIEMVIAELERDYDEAQARQNIEKRREWSGKEAISYEGVIYYYEGRRDALEYAMALLTRMRRRLMDGREGMTS